MWLQLYEIIPECIEFNTHFNSIGRTACVSAANNFAAVAAADDRIIEFYSNEKQMDSPLRSECCRSIFSLFFLGSLSLIYLDLALAFVE